MEKNKKTYKKKILFLSWRDIKAPKKGGAEIFTHEMIKRLDKNKFEIIHFSSSFNGGSSEEIIDGIKYIRDGSNLSVITRAKKYYHKNKDNIDYVVDQCNTHRFFTKFWVEKNKRIFFIHQLTREIWDMNTSFPMNVIGKITETPFLRLSKNDPTITVSESTKNDLINIGFSQNKITILPEGIDFIPWMPEKFLTKENDPTYIYVGRYSNYKGIDKVVEAFCKIKKLYPRAKLWIVGKKNQEYINKVLNRIIINYETKSTSINKSITYWGFVSEEKKLELMSRSHCLLFPSLREGWGLIVTEAAAVGTPSIGFDSPGIRDALKKGEAGYLCESNTIVDLVKLMKSVIEDENKYRHMREAAYKFSLNFHWDNTKNEFTKFIEQLED
jgi:glycosyltransferase involved in cell wall biosynthesis